MAEATEFKHAQPGSLYSAVLICRFHLEIALDDINPEHYLKDPKIWELWYIPYDG